MALIVGIIIYLAVVVFIIASFWKTFVKAGEPGWACIVPIYNIITILKIGGKPWWWIFLFMIPIVNIVFLVKMYHGVSLAFGKTAGFTVGLIFLGFIFWPILGFGDAQYKGASDNSGKPADMQFAAK